MSRPGSLEKVKIPGNGNVPSKSSIVETAPSVGSGTLLRMLTVVVLRGPMPTPAGVGFESATLKVFVGW